MGMRIDTWVIALAILIIIGIVLAVKSIQATAPYTTCTTNALKTM